MKKSEKNKSPVSGRVGVIYARYSSHNQKEESIEQQVEECRSFAAANGITINHIYADKAFSGRSDKRPQFQKMMRDAEKKQFTVVIAYKSNRIARNMFNALQYEDRLIRLGIETVYVKEEFGNTAAGRFALRTMMNVNQFYSENMAEDIRRGMKDNAESCKVNGSLPFGYKKGKDGKYEIDEPRAEIVREIFAKYLAGVPNVEICDSLNVRGIKTKTGGSWNKGSFHCMLCNERYIGVYEHSGVRIEGGVPAIISKEVFMAVQDRAKNKPNGMGVSRRGRADYLLTGKLFCGECGKPMIGISGTARNGELKYYYTCSGKRAGEVCNKSNIRRDYIEELVIKLTMSCIRQADILDFLVSGYSELREKIRQESELPLLSDELKDKKKALGNIMRAIEAGIFNDTTSQRMSELSEEIKALEREIDMIKACEASAPTEDEVRYYLEKLSTGKADNPNFKRDIINTFVRRVTLWNDKIEIEYNFVGNGPDYIRRSTDINKEGEGFGSYKGDEAPPIFSLLSKSSDFFIKIPRP